ncbi:deoxyribonuclease IV [bacterium]|jgi:deoxyribonuclease IV|nr:deoxyribonuclease IV [bacterium]
MSNRAIGLHIRYCDSIFEVIEKANRLDVAILQFFLTRKQDGGTMVSLSDEQLETFALQCKEKFERVVVHASYWTDLASGSRYGKKLLFNELRCASQLGCTDFVIHCGSARRFSDKSVGIKNVVKTLKIVAEEELPFKVLLENTTYENFYIGSDFEDFALLMDRVGSFEKFGFCLDTAHAHSYGYDISSKNALSKFLSYLDSTIGLKNIGLIHLNNTHVKKGARHDEHSVLDEGQIQEEIFRGIVCRPEFRNTPIILELPSIAEEQELIYIEKVKTWSLCNHEEKYD